MNLDSKHTNKLLVSKSIDIVIFFLSIVLFYPSIKWLLNVFFGLYDLFNLLMLLIILGLIGNKIKWRFNVKKNILSYNFKILPFVICILSIVLWFFSRNILHINILSALATFLYMFGVLGLYMDSKLWVNSIIPFLLIAMTLPFGNIMDVYIGFPLRLFAIDSIASMFNSLNYHNVSSSTIITIENSATQIDFSCSGIKGLWSGLLFYFAITWLDKLKININWLLTFSLLVITIISANILRIFLIVLLESVYDLPQLAEIVHAPLGIIGFVFSCLFIYFITQSTIYKRELIKFNLAQSFINKANLFEMRVYNDLGWSRVLIIVILVVSILIPQGQSIKTIKTPSLNFPTEWSVKPIKLSQKELSFFENQGSIATKTGFQIGDITGSLLLVNSNGWRGHHNPEYCIRAGGNKIDEIETIGIHKNFPIKWLTVNKESSACYWFQSPTIVTDDFGTRVWSELKTKEKDWVLVSVVFNNSQSIENKNIKTFILRLNQLIKEQKNNTNIH